MTLGRQVNESTSHGKIRASRVQVWLIAAIIVIFISWSAFAPLEEVVRGVGKVVPTTNNQVIQNLEGGIVKEIFVTEGDIVEAGQVVAKMDETRSRSAFQELQNQKWALSLKMDRLEAEWDPDTGFVPEPVLLEKAPEHAAAERRLYQARRQEYQTRVTNLDEAISLKEQEIRMLRQLVDQKAAPQMDLIRAQQSLVDTRSQLSDFMVEYESKRAQDYTDTLSNLRQVEEQVMRHRNELLRTDVRSPIKGVVNKVWSTTRGGVTQPGDPLIEVLSLEDELRIEGRIDPRDIGFVHVGMPATIKLTAFDFSIYGTLSGKVVHVGSDTVVDEKQQDPQPYYEAFIALKSDTLHAGAESVQIRPGMQAQMELKSGTKTVLQYILKPLFKTTEALSER